MTSSAGSPIGASLPRSRAARFVAGKGRYTDDFTAPRMLFAAFIRSPYAHARILHIDASAAVERPGALRVLTGKDIAAVCRPYRAVNNIFPTMNSPLQHAVAIEKVHYQGEPVAIVIADTRAQAEDAAERVQIDWEPLPAVTDAEAAASSKTPVIHEGFDTNLCFQTKIETPDIDKCLQEAAAIIEEFFIFGRHTGVPLEMRTILANYDASDGILTVTQSHQVPHELQGIYARQLGLAENKVHVICPDVGGAFGIKLQAYNDEIAICAAAVILQRPVKYQVDRLEAFISDVQARDHHVKAKIALDANNDILAFAVEDIFAIGPYPQFPRSSLQEGFHVIQLTGAPYRFRDYRGVLQVVFQNKVNAGLYRAVGQPISCALTERMIDMAARHAGRDPIDFRREHYRREAEFPCKSPSNVALTKMALLQCHDAVVDGMQIRALRKEQAAFRKRGILRGIGIATFVELVNPGPNYYTSAGLAVSAQDACTLRLEPGGTVRCRVSLSEFGQGTDFSIGQVVAATLGITVSAVEVECGDSWTAPFGGGSWASRGIMMGSEAGWRAARTLRESILKTAGQLLQCPADSLDIRAGEIVEVSGRARMSVAELANIAHYRQGLLPKDCQPELTATSHYSPRDLDYVSSAGVQSSYVEVDAETGFVRLLRHGVSHDSGNVINPLLLAEQLRGGAVQGIGSALYEECLYDEDGQLLNGTLADYLVPMAAEIPDIEIYDVATPWQPTGAPKPKGVGEAGVAGASAAILNAINDAIYPLGASIAQIPCTPERLLDAIDQARKPPAG